MKNSISNLAYKLGKLVMNKKHNSSCETYLENSHSYLQHSFLHRAQHLKSQCRKFKMTVWNYLVVQGTRIIPNALTEIDSNIKAYFSSPFKTVGLILLCLFYPALHYLNIIIPEDTGIYISEYYPDLHYFTFAIQDSLEPILILLAILLGFTKGDHTRKLLFAPLAFYIVNAYYILTASSNFEYNHPPIDLMASVLVFVGLIVAYSIRKKIIHSYYHGSRTSNLCRLIGVLTCKEIAWKDKEGLVKKITDELESSDSLVY